MIVFGVTAEMKSQFLNNVDSVFIEFFDGVVTQIQIDDFCKTPTIDWLFLLPQGMHYNAKPFSLLAQSLDSAHAGYNVSLIDALGLTSKLRLLANVTARPILSESLQGFNVWGGAHDGFVDSPPIRLEFAHGEDYARQSAAELLRSDQEGSSDGECLRVAMAFEVIGSRELAFTWYSRVASSSEAELMYRWLSFYRMAVDLEGRDADDNRFVAMCQNAIEIWPERIEPYILLARWFRRKGDPENAKSLLVVAGGAVIDKPFFSHKEVDYRQSRHVELAKCEKMLGNNAAVVRAINNYTTGALGRGVDQTLIKLRDESYEQLDVRLPAKSSVTHRFIILVPFYNAGDFLKKCVDSIASQKYTNYQVVFIDDASTDGAVNNIDFSELRAHQLIRNDVGVDALANQVMALRELTCDDDVVVFLDGDDWFAHDQVLSRLNDVYHATGCWLTYGQFVFSDSRHLGYARPIMPEEDMHSLFASSAVMFPIHLRTHKAGLFLRLLEQDPNLMCLRGSDGEYIAYASDVAHMRAMMLLAGNERIQFISEALYVYNTGNELSHFRQEPKGLSDNVKHISEMPALDQLRSYRRSTADQTLSDQILLDQRSATLGAPRAKLLVLAMDGYDSRVVDSMIADGELPNIASVFKKTRVLGTPKVYSSDVFWKGVIGGNSYGEFSGYYRSVVATKGYRENDIFQSEALASTVTFWDDLGLNGYRIAALNLPDIRLTQKIPGVTNISNWLMHARVWESESDPPKLIERLCRQGYDQSLQAHKESLTIREAEEIEDFVGHVELRLKVKASAYSELLDRGDWDLFWCGFDEGHEVMHQMWHFHDEQSPHYQGVAIDPIKASYRHADEILGESLLADPSQPIAMLCGLGGKSNCSMNSMMEEILVSVESVLRGGPVALDRRDRWFYSVSSAPVHAAICINLKGRDECGVVEAHEYDDFCDRLTVELLKLRGRHSGSAAVSEVVRLPEARSGEAAYRVPDLLIVWAVRDIFEEFGSGESGYFKFEPDESSVLDFRTGDHDSVASIYTNNAFESLVKLPESLNYMDVSKYFKSYIETA